MFDFFPNASRWTMQRNEQNFIRFVFRKFRNAKFWRKNVFRRKSQFWIIQFFTNLTFWSIRWKEFWLKLLHELCNKHFDNKVMITNRLLWWFLSEAKRFRSLHSLWLLCTAFMPTTNVFTIIGTYGIILFLTTMSQSLVSSWALFCFCSTYPVL